MDNNRQIGTGFINLDKVLRANQSNRLGQTVGRYIQQAGSRASEDINKAQTEFQTEAEKNRTDTQENKQFVGKTLENVGGRTPTPGSYQVTPRNTPQIQSPTPSSGSVNVSIPRPVTDKPGYELPIQIGGPVIPPSGQPVRIGQPYTPPQTPTEFKEPTQADQRRFQQIISGVYQGPTEIKNIADVEAKANQATELGNLSTSNLGRKQLLSNIFNGSDYTTGQKGLDALLLGQQGSDLAQARRSTQSLGHLASAAGEQAKTYADYLTGKAKQFGEQTLKDINTSKLPESDLLNRQVREKLGSEQERKKLFEDLQKKLTYTTPNDTIANTSAMMSAESDPVFKAVSAIKTMQNQGIISADDAKALLGDQSTKGLIARAKDKNMEFLKELQDRITLSDASNVSRTGLASDEQIARLNALDKLAGKVGEFHPGQERYQAGANKFNLQSFKEAVENAEKNANSYKQSDYKYAAPQSVAQSLLDQGLGFAADLATAPLTIPLGLAGGIIGGTPGKWLTSAGNFVGDLGSGAASAIGRGIKSVFCFTGDTDIMMEDGSFKKLKDLKINDKIALGGRVTAIGQGLISDIHQYEGFKVSGSHAIYENGKWLRVEESQKSYPVGKEKETLVYPIATENHLMVTKSNKGLLVSADMEEIDDTYNMTDDEIISKLNSDTLRNKKIQRFLNTNANSNV
jgi:hypothetical protein